MSLCVDGTTLGATAYVQKHQGVTTRLVGVSRWLGGKMSPHEAQEFALTILDAARVALSARAPTYPKMFSKEGDPLSSDWDDSRRGTKRAARATQETKSDE